MFHKAAALGKKLSEWNFYYWDTKEMKMIHSCGSDMAGPTCKGQGWWD